MGRPQFQSPTDISEQTLQALNVQVNANTANQLDTDVQNIDVSSGAVIVPEQSISGAIELTAAFTQNGSGDLDISVEWTDGSGNVLFVENPSDLQGLTGSDFENLIVKSTHVRIVGTGTSQDVSGTVNAH